MGWVGIGRIRGMSGMRGFEGGVLESSPGIGRVRTLRKPVSRRLFWRMGAATMGSLQDVLLTRKTAGLEA